MALVVVVVVEQGETFVVFVELDLVVVLMVVEQEKIFLVVVVAEEHNVQKLVVVVVEEHNVQKLDILFFAVVDLVSLQMGVGGPVDDIWEPGKMPESD